MRARCGGGARPRPASGTNGAGAGGRGDPAHRPSRRRLDALRLPGAGGPLRESAGRRPLAGGAAFGAPGAAALPGRGLARAGRLVRRVRTAGGLGPRCPARAAARPVHGAHPGGGPRAGAALRDARRAQRGAGLRLPGERAPGGGWAILLHRRAGDLDAVRLRSRRAAAIPRGRSGRGGRGEERCGRRTWPGRHPVPAPPRRAA